MELNDTISNSRIKGSLSIMTTDKRTGEILDHYADSNVVVLDHRKIFVKLINQGLENYRVNRYKIGDDVGSGTESDPEPADETFTAVDQNVLYNTTEGIQVSHSGDLLTIYNIFINGEDVMEEHPTEDSISFTSIGLYSNNEILFSYKRFPARTITSTLNINILWRIYYEE